jgi:hypothetical protein
MLSADALDDGSVTPSRRAAATRCRAAITPATRKKPRVAAKRPFGT